MLMNGTLSGRSDARNKHALDRVHARFLPSVSLLSALLIGGMSCSTPKKFDNVRVVSISEARVPDAEIDRHGFVHVAYVSGNDVYYLRSEDNGETFSVPIRVNSETGFASGGLFRGPDIAVDEADRVHVVWYNNAYVQDRPKDEWGVMYAQLNPGEASFGPNRNLDQTPSDGFSIAVNDRSQVAVLWIADSLYYRQSSDAGVSFSPALGILASPCDCCSTRALLSNEGRLTFLYRANDDDVRDMYLGTYSIDAGTFYRLQLNSVSWTINACPMSGGSLRSETAHVIASWESKGEIFLGLIDQQSSQTGPTEILVSNKGKYPIAIPGSNNYLVAWKEGARLRWQHFDGNGNAEGRIESIATNTRDQPASVYTDSGTFLLFP